MRLVQPAFLLVALARCAAPPPHTATLSGLDVLQALADSGKELPRPRLAAGADTNDPSLYYNLGEALLLLRDKLDTAEMALYWASRLDPSSAAAPFARSLIPLSALRNDAFETWLRTHSLRSVNKLTLPLSSVPRPRLSPRPHRVVALRDLAALGAAVADSR